MSDIRDSLSWTFPSANPTWAQLIDILEQQEENYQSRLTTLETEVRTLKTQMKLAAGFIKNGY